ncbi:hypothetical protein GBF38_009637, partial [Nibea albiflora]
LSPFLFLASSINVLFNRFTSVVTSLEAAEPGYVAHLLSSCSGTTSSSTTRQHSRCGTAKKEEEEEEVEDALQCEDYKIASSELEKEKESECVQNKGDQN